METLAQWAALDVTPTDETTVLVVDHHRSFADLLSAALSALPGLRCVGTAASASEGIAFASKLRPDIVMMDIQMPGQDGLQAIRTIREVSDASVAVVTAHSDPVWISRAAQVGASAFILKDGSLREMIDVLRRVRPGQMIVAPAALRGDRPVAERSSTAIRPMLTPRELEVLSYLGTGMPTVNIARVLGITVQTCRSYLKSLHCKLGASTQLDLVIKAQRMGLVATG